MALLKRSFMRRHPIQSGMVWALGYVPLFLAVGWVTGLFHVTAGLVAIVIGLGIIAGLAWGYSMKAYHDRVASR